jgi:hypothetical protein
LNRSETRLDLPAVKIRATIGDGPLQVAHQGRL